MTTASCKAKGRKFQQAVCKALLSIGKDFGLVDDDITSRGMGQNGTDAILTPAARKVFGELAVECKAVESINLSSTFHAHAAKYPSSTPVLFHTKNRTGPLAILRLSDYIVLLRAFVAAKGTT